MTEIQLRIIEAAFEVAEADQAMECGMPADDMKKKAYNGLIDVCAEYASENDGQLTI